MGGVFISYRRDDSQGSTGRVADRLHQLLGDDVPLFIDVDSIRPGQDFREVITDTLSRCDVTLVMIGPRWATVTDDEGRARLSDPTDLHRLEVESSLASSATTIPVLVEGASMPGPDEIPESIRDLAYRHAAEISVRRFAADAEYLADLIRAEIAARATPAVAAEPPGEDTPPLQPTPPPPPDPTPEPPRGLQSPDPELDQEPAGEHPPEPTTQPPVTGSANRGLDRRIIAAGVLGLVALLVVIIVAATRDDDGPTTGPDTTTSVSGAPATDRTPVFDLEIGDCFAAESSSSVTSVEPESCADLHHNEVFAIWNSFSPGLPSDETLLDGCESRFEDAVGQRYASSIYWIGGYWPDAAAWDEGSRTVICYGYVRDGQGVSIATTGSMLGSGN